MTIQYYVNPAATTEVTKYNGVEFNLALPDGRFITGMPDNPNGDFDLWPEGVVALPAANMVGVKELYAFTGSAVNVSYEEILFVEGPLTK